MNLLREKMMKYDAPQRAKAAGIYPYFRAIESDQDTEVVISGKKVLMFGSNAYLGLTNHPKVIEAAVAATKNMGPEWRALVFKWDSGYTHRIGEKACQFYE